MGLSLSAAVLIHFAGLIYTGLNLPKPIKKLKNQSFQGIAPSLFILSSLSRSQSIKILEFSLVK
jgi:uncharacterized protein with PQ loop repeat